MAFLLQHAHTARALQHTAAQTRWVCIPSLLLLWRSRTQCESQHQCTTHCMSSDLQSPSQLSLERQAATMRVGLAAQKNSAPLKPWNPHRTANPAYVDLVPTSQDARLYQAKGHHEKKNDSLLHSPRDPTQQTLQVQSPPLPYTAAVLQLQATHSTSHMAPDGHTYILLPISYQATQNRSHHEPYFASRCLLSAPAARSCCQLPAQPQPTQNRAHHPPLRASLAASSCCQILLLAAAAAAPCKVQHIKRGP